MNYKLPEDAIRFETKDDFIKFRQDWYRHNRVMEFDSYPDSFPCVGWHVRTVYNYDTPDLVIWAFLYEKED